LGAGVTLNEALKGFHRLGMTVRPQKSLVILS
jgi:hypothetical protein